MILEGSHYSGGDYRNYFNCCLYVEYSSQENPIANNSTVSWAVKIVDWEDFRPWQRTKYINGSWQLDMGHGILSSGPRQQINYSSSPATLDSGSFTIGHDDNGNSALPVTFITSLGYFAEESYYSAWQLPQIDRNYATLHQSVIGVTTTSITYRFTNNYPVNFVFNNANYSIENYWSSLDITISGLNSNQAYTFGTHGIWNRYNGIATPNWANPEITYATNGYCSAYFNPLDITKWGNHLRINNLPHINAAASSLQWQYSTDNQSTWHNLSADGNIWNLNYHTSYNVAARMVAQIYNNNALQTVYLTSSVRNITTLYNLPNFQVDFKNTGIDTQMLATVNIISTNGCENSYFYSIRVEDNSGGVIKESNNSAKAASYSFTYSGLAGKFYKIVATAKDDDGQIASRVGASVICGATTSPTIVSAIKLVPYISTLSFSGLTCKFFSAGKIREQLLINNKEVYSKETRASIGEIDLTSSYKNLVPNTWYTLKITLSDINSHNIFRTYEFKTYPKVPELKNGISLIGEPKPKSFNISWEDLLDPYHSKNLNYDIKLTTGTETVLSTNTQTNSKNLINLIPETTYLISVTPKNEYTYNQNDIRTYILEVKTPADVWLKLHLSNDADGLFNRYKIFLINSTYPLGLELKKPGVKVIK